MLNNPGIIFRDTKMHPTSCLSYICLIFKKLAKCLLPKNVRNRTLLCVVGRDAIRHRIDTQNNSCQVDGRISTSTHLHNIFLSNPQHARKTVLWKIADILDFMNAWLTEFANKPCLPALTKENKYNATSCYKTSLPNLFGIVFGPLLWP